eukprot:CAMPEP_0114660396 /NCGR_PEP_ID=MMETSP0191-20121206/19911_1 /TAXON_ID=126664 /ORGANISM="Sorites sp." /LENGTH=38 /DNA_ID= /DNA_START= /DNA_END= /DNA_ORIENTATION=
MAMYDDEMDGNLKLPTIHELYYYHFQLKNILDLKMLMD